MVYGYNTSYQSIKTFYLNNTKAKTFQITTPISFKRTTNTSSTTGVEKIYLNSVNIRIYKNGVLYASSVPYEASILLNVYSTSDLSPFAFFTTNALSYSYQIYLTNIFFSFTTDSVIRDTSSATITSHLYDIQATVNWDKNASVFLGTNQNPTTGFVFNTTVSSNTAMGGSFTSGSYASSADYKSANLSDITIMNTVSANKIIHLPFVISTPTYILSLSNIQSLIILSHSPSRTNITISLPNNIDASYSGSIIEFRKHPASSTSHTTTFSKTGLANLIDISGNNQTAISTFTTASSAMRLLYYVDVNQVVWWMFLYRS
jgi:hypothetical protein